MKRKHHHEHVRTQRQKRDQFDDHFTQLLERIETFNEIPSFIYRAYEQATRSCLPSTGLTWDWDHERGVRILVSKPEDLLYCTLDDSKSCRLVCFFEEQHFEYLIRESDVEPTPQDTELFAQIVVLLCENQWLPFGAQWVPIPLLNSCVRNRFFASQVWEQLYAKFVPEFNASS